MNPMIGTHPYLVDHGVIIFVVGIHLANFERHVLLEVQRMYVVATNKIFFLKSAERKRKFSSFVENKVEKVRLGSDQVSPSQSLLFRAFFTKFSSLIHLFIYLLR